MLEVKVIHPAEFEKEADSGAMTRLAGVSEKLAGAQGIYMGISSIPPGCSSSPHHHTNCESAIYVVSGHGKMLTGERLDKSQNFDPGDVIYVPPLAVHLPVNRSDTEPLTLVVARNSPEEIVEEYKGPIGGDHQVAEAHQGSG